MGLLVRDQITAIPLQDGLLGLSDGYRWVMGAAPAGPALAALGAQLALESRNFSEGHCFNWCNKKLPAGSEEDYCQFRCDEIFDQATMARARMLGPCQVALWKGGPKWRVTLIPPHPWSSFCAYQNAAQGCKDYVDLIATADRYRAAWHQALAGQSEAFGRALGAADYYTADVEAYTRGLVSISKHILPACMNIANYDPHGIDDAFRFQVESLVNLTLAESNLDQASPSLINEELT